MSSSRAPTRPATGPTVALVPLRSPGVGKTRLAGALSVEDRGALAGAMLADVVSALRGSGVDRIVVAASGAPAAAAASAIGVEVLRDPEPEVPPSAEDRLDRAVAAAAARLRAIATLVVVAADLPRLRPVDVDALLDERADVVVAPTIDGGTGALLRRPPDVCRTAYGAGSAARHLALARATGARTVRRELPGFAYDVDVVADLAPAHDPGAPPLGPRTAALLTGPLSGLGAGWAS